MDEKCMFNKNKKEEFINYRLSETTKPFADGYLDRWFSRTYVYEKELNKDLCNFTMAELINFYTQIESSSFLTLKNLNTQFSLYWNWCKKEGICKNEENPFSSIPKDLLEKCVNKTRDIITREEIEFWCKNLIVNARDAFAILCVFEGIKGKGYEEIANIKLEDLKEEFGEYYVEIKKENGEIRKPRISKLLHDIAIKAYREHTYYTIEGNNSKELQDSNMIFKDYLNATRDSQRGRTIYNAINRNLKHLSNDRLSTSTLFDSGRLYMIKAEAAKYNMPVMEYIKSPHTEKVKEQYGDERLVKTYLISKYKDLL